MAARTDLLLDTNGDLPIGAALMTTGPSDEQHQKDMALSNPGDWKQYPQNGIGIGNYVKSTGIRLLQLQKEARQQLVRDGYNVLKLQFKTTGNDKLIIDQVTTR